MVLTDSGGIQEEAPSLGKPVVVMREVTEWPDEAVEAGTVRLVGADAAKIVHQVSALLTDETAYASMSKAHNPNGVGKAAERIEDRFDTKHRAGSTSMPEMLPDHRIPNADQSSFAR